MATKGIYSMFKEAGVGFGEDEAMTQGAAVAFYTALSIAPLLVILLTIVGFTSKSGQDQVTHQIQSLVGSQAGGAIDMIVKSASQQKHAGTIAAIVSIITLAFSATGMFAQIQNALNDIWDVEAKPGQGLWNWIRKRILTFGLLVSVAFLLLVSMILSAGLSMVFSGTGVIWQIINFAVSFVVSVILFALLYKILPDAKIRWHDVWAGAIFTAILFVIGKFLIGKYLGYSSVGSAYGAAGSLIALLVWVYYSSLILFFGAELTQAYAHQYGRAIEPDIHAEPERQTEEKPAAVTKGKEHPSRERQPAQGAQPGGNGKKQAPQPALAPQPWPSLKTTWPTLVVAGLMLLLSRQVQKRMHPAAGPAMPASPKWLELIRRAVRG